MIINTKEALFNALCSMKANVAFATKDGIEWYAGCRVYSIALEDGSGDRFLVTLAAGSGVKQTFSVVYWDAAWGTSRARRLGSPQ